MAQRNKLRPDIIRPSNDQVQFYLKKWDSLEAYTVQEKALDRLFLDVYPSNNDIEEVLIKASALNSFYYTNIFSIFPVAKHIVDLNINDRLAEGDESLVNEIALVKMDNGSIKNFYSFASKYCSRHRPSEFPIYDSYVDRLLRYFRDADKFTAFKTDDLKIYMNYKRVLLEFKSYYELNKFDLKEIDKYLWQLGKEKFPIKY